MQREGVLGVLGGMGPEATAYFMLLVIKLTPAEKDQDHIEMIVLNDPKIPDRTAAILEGGPSPVPRIIRDLRLLESLGVDLVAVPCNTFFYFYDEVAGSTSLPIVHMIKESAKLVYEAGVDSVGLLATSGTVEVGLYQRCLESRGVRVTTPQNQSEVMRAIYEIKAGRKEEARRVLLRAAKSLIEEGAQIVVAGCTEVPLVLSKDDVPLLDPMEVVARLCIDRLKGTSLTPELRQQIRDLACSQSSGK